MGGPHVYAGIVSVVLGLTAASVTFLSAGLLRCPHRQIDHLRSFPPARGRRGHGRNCGSFSGALQSVLVGAFTWIVSWRSCSGSGPSRSTGRPAASVRTSTGP